MKYVGTCSIEWLPVLEAISTLPGEIRSCNEKFYKNTDGRFDEIIRVWKAAGYDKNEAVEWINYYPSVHFDNSVISQFENFTNTRCVKSWISCIKPGKYAPYHWDVDDQVEEYLKKGSLTRFTVIITNPIMGQVFMAENTTLHNKSVGEVYEWDSYLAWHAGGNCSFKPKYLFNFIGIKNV